MVADGILTTIQAEIEKLHRYLDKRRDALLDELATIERIRGIHPTTKELRKWWREGGLGSD